MINVWIGPNKFLTGTTFSLGPFCGKYGTFCGKIHLLSSSDNLHLLLLTSNTKVKLVIFQFFTSIQREIFETESKNQTTKCFPLYVCERKPCKQSWWQYVISNPPHRLWGQETNSSIKYRSCIFNLPSKYFKGTLMMTPIGNWTLLHKMDPHASLMSDKIKLILLIMKMHWKQLLYIFFISVFPPWEDIYEEGKGITLKEEKGMLQGKGFEAGSAI